MANIITWLIHNIIGGAQWHMWDTVARLRSLIMNHCAANHCVPDVPRGHFRLKKTTMNSQSSCTTRLHGQYTTLLIGKDNIL